MLKISLAIILIATRAFGFATVVTEEQVVAFKNRQAAHKMRLLQHAAEIMQNPNFYKYLPEYTFMKDKISEILSYVAAHDTSKLNLPNDNEIVKTLASIDGVVVRDLPASDPRKKPSIQAIKGITAIDISAETMDAEARFKDSTQRKKIEQFLTMIDKKDVTEGRIDEFGGDRSKIKTGTEYIREMKGLSAEEKEGLLRVGAVVEKGEFKYSEDVRSIKSVDYKSFDKEADKLFKSKFNKSYIPNPEIKKYLQEVSKVHLEDDTKMLAKILSKAEGSFSRAGKAMAIYGYGTTSILFTRCRLSKLHSGQNTPHK